MQLSEMTKEERSLLLYFESCAVDKGGAVDSRRMNQNDFIIAQQWCVSGFIKFGRVYSKDVREARTHWVELSDEAWIPAHQERRNRADRMGAKQYWGIIDVGTRDADKNRVV